MRLGHVASVFVLQVTLGFAVLHCSAPDAPRLGGPNALEGKEHPRPPTADETNPSGGLCGDGKGAIDGGPCTVSFATDIVPLLTGTGWSCATSNCHAGTAAPKMTPGDNKQIWESLRKESTSGKPYINPCSIDPATSAFECNLQATGACGTKMPFAPGVQATETELKKVRDWLTCGSPFN